MLRTVTTIFLNYAEKCPPIVLKANVSNFKFWCAAFCKVGKIRGRHTQLDFSGWVTLYYPILLALVSQTPSPNHRHFSRYRTIMENDVLNTLIMSYSMVKDYECSR